jgi:hypothetical protein
MKILLLIGSITFMPPERTEADNQRATPMLAPSAQIDVPPSPSKSDLIRRFLRAIGRQAQLDTGSFLERHAMPGGAMWRVTTGASLNESFAEGFARRRAALIDAYARHRAEYQQEYESHLNWEFTENELREIVGFLEGPTGRHFLDGRWRMDAYVGSNTEGIEEQIVSEAMAALAQ